MRPPVTLVAEPQAFVAIASFWKGLCIVVVHDDMADTRTSDNGDGAMAAASFLATFAICLGLLLNDV